jgi:hypothetical protein
LESLPSGDRRERLCSGLGRLEDSHWITLPIHDILNRF